MMLSWVDVQEGICADAASFDLPSGYLTACISEAKQCVDVCMVRRAIEKSANKQHDPDNYAILRGISSIQAIMIVFYFPSIFVGMIMHSIYELDHLRIKCLYDLYIFCSLGQWVN